MKKLSPEVYFGKECADSIKELLDYAKSLDFESREYLAKETRNEAEKTGSDIARTVLTDLARQIESMEDLE